MYIFVAFEFLPFVNYYRAVKFSILLYHIDDDDDDDEI